MTNPKLEHSIAEFEQWQRATDEERHANARAILTALRDAYNGLTEDGRLGIVDALTELMRMEEL